MSVCKQPPRKNVQLVNWPSENTTLLLFFIAFFHAESQRGMEIAYKMLDKDGNGRLCKDEFLVVSSFLTD